MPDFNRVIIRNTTEHEENIHLSVHPFPMEDGIRMMMHRGDYGLWEREKPLAQWKKELADALWDGIPGLQHLFFNNGQITLQHHGVFPDAGIIEAAEAIIRPVLETQLRLQALGEQP